MDSSGYMTLRLPDHPLANKQGYVLEHRKIAWDALGPFPVENHVHHINHDKRDNRIENLEVLTPLEHRHAHRELDRGEALRLYESGLSTSEVAVVMGTHAGNVSRMIRDAGGKARDVRSMFMRSLPWDKIDADLRSGEPVGRIARNLGVAHNVIDRRREHIGVAKRRAGRPA